MSDVLKKLYAERGLLHFYFDDTVPVDLYRGQSTGDAQKGLPVIYPNPGFVRKTGEAREPDVAIVERDGKRIVLGCFSIKGLHRGISTFDRPNPALRNFRWYKLGKGGKIHSALAITQDDDHKDKVNHYTIAPKNDMPLELFLVCLGAMEKDLIEV